MKQRVACIGSRQIANWERDLFFNIGKFIVSGGDYISTGNAKGSDQVFASGGNEINPKNVLIYLPWKNYETYTLNKDNRVLYEPKDEWFDLTAPFHPGWQNLSQGVKRLMARNYGILNRADKCIARLNHEKSNGGGTGQGVRIANSLNIPVLDLNDKSFNEIITFLES